MHRVLYTSADVRSAVIELFSRSRGRRVAVAAFVGEGAESYLPKPDGLELVCWPKAGGTNPNVLRSLASKAVKISFANAVHMKVYWTSDRGVVITSANLSTNALGAGNLREFGVLLPSGFVDIRRVLRSLAVWPMSARELLQLDREHGLVLARSRGELRDKVPPVTFEEWYAGPSRRLWKLGWWDSYVPTVAKAVRELVKSDYAIKEPYNFLSVPKAGYQNGDWVLMFRMSDGKVKKIEWLFVDHIVQLSRSERGHYSSQYPCELVQVWPPRRYPPPPFRLDAGFKAALRRAVNDFSDEDEQMTRIRPTTKLINRIAAHYRRA